VKTNQGGGRALHLPTHQTSRNQENQVKISNRLVMLAAIVLLASALSGCWADEAARAGSGLVDEAGRVVPGVIDDVGRSVPGVVDEAGRVIPGVIDNAAQGGDEAAARLGQIAASQTEEVRLALNLPEAAESDEWDAYLKKIVCLLADHGPDLAENYAANVEMRAVLDTGPWALTPDQEQSFVAAADQTLRALADESTSEAQFVAAVDDFCNVLDKLEELP
jgi:hypothetical protein